MSEFTQSPDWQKLEQHHQAIRNQRIDAWFVEDPKRAERFSLQAAGLRLDYSKQHITAKTRDLLVNLAGQSGLAQAIESLFAGDKVNCTEQRPAWHTKLRANDDPQVVASLEKMLEFATQIHQQQWRGYTGKPITDVVNLGIGGSDLGPRMVVEALAPFHVNSLKVHFVANVDGADISDCLASLNPETTLFIVASKSFSTEETLTNANTARTWLMQDADASIVAKHFVAVSANVERAVAFGIIEDNIFEFWDWVGGRFSLWSAIGLPIGLAIGMENFQQLLAGAHAMDQHFATASFKHNMPVILALLSIWSINFDHCPSEAVIPYDQHLRLLPAYLQQLVMESNGKSVDKHGNQVDYATAVAIWGDVGTNGQHAFHQLLHQGMQTIPVDFIIVKQPQHNLTEHHRKLLANALAQSRALMLGKSDDNPHKVIAGNKPSNTILLEKLTPNTLGSLIALYEHKTFVQGIIWRINSFDQYGVELGKVIAKDIEKVLMQPDALEKWLP